MRLKNAKPKQAVAAVVALPMLLLFAGCGLLDTAKNAIKQPSFQERYDAAVFTNCDDLELVKEYIETKKVDVNGTVIDPQTRLNVSPLYLVQSQNYEPAFAKYLLDAGASPDIAYENTSLLMCSSNADFSKMLIERGADVNLDDGNGLTALAFEVREGAIETVNLLLEHGAKVTDEVLDAVVEKRADGFEYSMARIVFEAAELQGVESGKHEIFALSALGKSDELIDAIENDNGEYAECIPFYAAAYCTPDVLEYFENRGFDLAQNDDYNHSLLWVAASEGNTEMVEYLVASGFSLDFRTYDPLDYDPLRMAIQNNHYETVKYMLESGAVFNIDESLGYDGGIGDVTSYKQLPDDSLQCAASNGNIEMIELLDAYGFPMDKNTYYRALKIAIVYNQQDAIKYFLDKGADPNYVDNRFADNSALFDICASKGNLEMMKLLYEYGATVKTDTSDALSDAVDSGNYDIAKFLLEKGMGVNSHQRFDDGSATTTPWDKAGRHGYFDIIKLLLEHGADINGGHDPMIVMYAKGSGRITKYLIDKGADVNAQDSEGDTALHVAALNHRTANAKALLAAGADPSIKNDEGKTALDIAKEAGATDVEKIIKGA